MVGYDGGFCLSGDVPCGARQFVCGMRASRGETHRESDLLFTVEEADRRRVYRVRVEPVAASESPVEASPRAES